MNSIFRFIPRLKHVIWGGDAIARYKGEAPDATDIGESWEISVIPGMESVVANGADRGKRLSELCKEYGARLLGTKVLERYGQEFPLLVKLIDAHEDLSLQVHPDDNIAALRHGGVGKTEMWYVIDCEDNAFIRSGLTRAMSRDNYVQMVTNGTIMDAVALHKSRRGQVYLNPAGTIHAIGKGNLIAEIQQSSDITYRVYDYDRLDANGQTRELHTEYAADAIDYTFPSKNVPCGELCTASKVDVVTSPYFSIDFIKTGQSEKTTVSHGGESFRIVMITDGEAILHCGDTSTRIKRGETILIPAEENTFSIEGQAEGLIVRIS